MDPENMNDDNNIDVDDNENDHLSMIKRSNFTDESIIEDQETDSEMLDSSDNGNSRPSSHHSSSDLHLQSTPGTGRQVSLSTTNNNSNHRMNSNILNLNNENNQLNFDFTIPTSVVTETTSDLFFSYQQLAAARNAAFNPFISSASSFSNSPSPIATFLSPTLFKPTTINYMQNNLLHSIASNSSQLHPLNLTFANSPPTTLTTTTTPNSTVLTNGTSVHHSSNSSNTNKAPKLEVTTELQPSSGGSKTNNCVATNNNNNNNVSKRPSSSNLLCVVCGDLSSGKHYGILACNGCSGFFKRSVRRKLIYRCQAGTGSCIIDKQHRNQCQACRLKKCISMGMNKDAVQNERQPRNTATIRPEVLLSDSNSERLLREGVAATVAAVFGLSNCGLRQNSNKSHSTNNGSNNNNNNNEIHNKISKENKRFSDSKGNTNKDCQELAFQLGASTNICYSPNLSDYSGGQLSEITNPLIILNPDSFYEISAGLLFTGVKWIKNLPSFASLNFRDQVVLLEESWTEIFILNAIQWSLPLDKCSIFSPNNIPNGEEYMLDIRVLNDMFERFRTMSVGSAEFACLKALALFKPEARGLKDVSKIEQMQDQIQSMLLQQVKNQNPANPIRFGKLLLLLLSLKIIPAEKIASIYFKKAIGNTTIEKLLCEMFKC